MKGDGTSLGDANGMLVEDDEDVMLSEDSPRSCSTNVPGPFLRVGNGGGRICGDVSTSVSPPSKGLWSRIVGFEPPGMLLIGKEWRGAERACSLSS